MWEAPEMDEDSPSIETNGVDPLRPVFYENEYSNKCLLCGKSEPWMRDKLNLCEECELLIK